MAGLIFTSRDDSPSQIIIWDLIGKTKRVLAGEFVSAAISPDKETLAVGNRNGKTVDFYQLDDLTLVKQLEVNREPSFTLKFSPDSKKIAFIASSPPNPTKPYSRSIYLHSVEDGSLLNIFNYPPIFSRKQESPKDIAISPDGRYLAVPYRRSAPSSFFIGAPRPSKARFYGRIRLWRIEDGKQLQTLRGHKYRTDNVVFMPNSQLLTSTGADGKVRFWKVPSRNYSWFLMFGGLSLTALVYSRRSELISLFNR
ncbi:MAG: hypothetical protein AAFR77_22555 [Cyanobacteria bacterium J06631_2]